MNTFSWLVIGHLVGDWLLQNDWMAKGKRRGLVTAAGMTHFAIYTLSILAALALFHGAALPPRSYGLAAALVFATHWLVDATDIVDAWMRLCRQTKVPLVRLMVDQTFHFLVLAAVPALIGR